VKELEAFSVELAPRFAEQHLLTQWYALRYSKKNLRIDLRGIRNCDEIPWIKKEPESSDKHSTE